MTSDLKAFAERIARLDLTQAGMAAALLWFHDHQDPGHEITAGELGNLLDGLALTSGINRTRLASQLKAHPATVRGTKADRFRISLKKRHELDVAYLPLLKRRRIVFTDALLPQSQVKGSRAYLEKLADQINGCYSVGFHDACAVLCRRVIESLLIDAFTAAGYADKIKHNRDFMQLSGIIGVANSGHYIRLSKGSDRDLDQIKEVGDRAAHHRSYITQKQDIDLIAPKFRALVSELMAKANIAAKL